MNQQKPTSKPSPWTGRTFDLNGVRFCTLKLPFPGTSFAWVAWPEGKLALHFGRTMHAALGAVLVHLAVDIYDEA